MWGLIVYLPWKETQPRWRCWNHPGLGCLLSIQAVQNFPTKFKLAILPTWFTFYHKTSLGSISFTNRHDTPIKPVYTSPLPSTQAIPQQTDHRYHTLLVEKARNIIWTFLFRLLKQQKCHSQLFLPREHFLCTRLTGLQEVDRCT